VAEGPSRRLWIALAASLVPGAVHVDASPRSTSATVVGRDPARGAILRRTLRSDSNQEYLMYVSTRAARGASILVAVHGVSRNFEEHAQLFAPYAEKQGVVLIAPSFTPERNEGYQRLSEEGAAQRADLALDAIIAEVAAATGADGSRFRLFGFSGGAQFAHRYALAHPERVISAAIGAAGWYTFPDNRTPYPYGLGASPERSTLRFDPSRFLRVPIAVFVGDADTTGGENFRSEELLDVQQGTTRRERAQRWVEAMNQAARQRRLALPASYHEVPGIEHSFRQFMTEGHLGERVFDALFGSSSQAGASP
jgi:poly(3-hydroxybutyrate) depolymerase